VGLLALRCMAFDDQPFGSAQDKRQIDGPRMDQIGGQDVPEAVGVALDQAGVARIEEELAVSGADALWPSQLCVVEAETTLRYKRVPLHYPRVRSRVYRKSIP
jgi:hypothetical protein